ncbi:hypothetical protein H6761_01660 [Candidatus Nomurabacteria bacterium]|nr:hypothetical protein [Candidatus Nomurabacteria bacterium]
MSNFRKIKIWYRNIPILKKSIITRYYQRLFPKNKQRIVIRYRKLGLL